VVDSDWSNCELVQHINLTAAVVVFRCVCISAYYSMCMRPTVSVLAFTCTLYEVDHLMRLLRAERIALSRLQCA
jgi:hypothetical protein